jgi:PncC family amidohydrolase
MGVPLEARVGEALRIREWTLALGESCTGGLVGYRITQMPGSSEYFLGGIVAYSNQAKEKLLNVHPETLKRYGAVSEKTAMEMAEGARQAFASEVGLSITGIAGPDSDSSEKPVGLTWIAISTPAGTYSECHHWKGDRTSNKRRSAQAALKLLYRLLSEQA